ncbi:hypothetical protein PIB30_074368 [Stylosanthes scabra]|uniref:Uncharacterized protein n=1 Tax=Stylosanthes scabra TaxID=79078 RepID=A0ABU6ZN92_9FABA|nr:hypothetical protein [Stylosanthes scabra]
MHKKHRLLQIVRLFQKLRSLEKDGIDPDFEATLDRMFLETVATGEDSWAPSSGTFPYLNENVIEYEDSDDYTENLKKDMTKNKRKERDMSRKSNNSSKRVKKVGGAQRLSHQIDCLCEAVERRSSNIDTCGASIKTAMEHLKAISDLDSMSEIYMFATRLFLNKDKREIIVSITQSRVKLAWLISEKNEHDMADNLMSRLL